MKRQGKGKKGKHRESHLGVVNMYKDDWWLEHLENEHEPNLREDLEILLKNSKSDRKILESLKTTRQLIKSSDDVAMPENGFIYGDLHDRIMLAIENEEDAKPPRSARTVSSTVKRSVWSGTVFGTFGLTMMMAVVSFFVLKQSNMLPQPVPMGQLSQVSSEASLDAQAALHGGSFQDVGGDAEFITQAAADKLDHMSVAEARAALESLHN